MITTTNCGAIGFVGDFFEVTKCVFNNNLAKSDNGNSYCGAISVDSKSATLIFCSFYNNTCISVSNTDNVEFLRIDCCNFTNNTANCICDTSI